MPKYFGTTEGIIDWNPVVQACEQCTTGDKNTVTSVVDRSEAEAEGPHFDIEIQNKFAKIINAEPLRVFVSEVDPGRNVPYHWDVEDKEDEWLKLGELKRWVCFMDKPRWGNILILEDECFHNSPQGEIWEWDNYRSYHAGTSMGIHKQYMFHFLGRPNK